MRSLSTPLLLISLLLLPAVTVSAGNGGSRGGGNGLVCFGDQSIVDELRGGYDKPVAIPDSYLGRITSISILDWEETNRDAGESDKPILAPERDFTYPLFDDADFNSRQIFEYKFGGYLLGLDQEYERLIARYDGAIPEVYSALERAKQMLPVFKFQDPQRQLTFDTNPEGPALEFTGEVEQLNDFVQFHHTPGCMVSTLFNQWQDPQDGTYHWIADRRLFFHRKQSLASHLASILHERVYWISREKTGGRLNAGPTYFFAKATLEADTTYREARDRYNNLFLKQSDWIFATTSGPARWLSTDLGVQFNALLTPLLATWPRPPAVTAQALSLYDSKLRAQVLNYPKISQNVRESLDQYFRHLIQGERMDRDPSWPEGFESSELPLPEGFQIEPLR